MSTDSRIEGSHYRVSAEEVARFRADGYVHLRGVLREDELAQIEDVYMQFVDRRIPVPGRDYCDMSGDYTRRPEDFSLINVMLPRKYHPAWQGNLYERRAATIAAQLQGEGLAIDYDQLLAKRPAKSDAVFHWHQDLAYWPITPDPRTATLWLALDDSTEENGCMRFVRGSHREAQLRDHRPVLGDRDKSHTLIADVDEARDDIRLAEIRRGDVTVHDERVVHGSGGNRSQRWRRAYILAFRSEDTIRRERAMGFTHSHQDTQEVLRSVGEAGEAAGS